MRYNQVPPTTKMGRAGTVHTAHLTNVHVVATHLHLSRYLSTLGYLSRYTGRGCVS